MHSHISNTIYISNRCDAQKFVHSHPPKISAQCVMNALMCACVCIQMSMANERRQEFSKVAICRLQSGCASNSHFLKRNAYFYHKFIGCPRASDSAPRHFGTSALRHLGTSAHRRLGTSTIRHLSTSAPQHASIEIGTSALGIWNWFLSP